MIHFSDEPCHHAAVHEGLAEALAYAKANEQWSCDYARTNRNDAVDCAGVGWSDIPKLVQEGWHEGAEMMAEGLAVNFPKQGRANTWRRDVYGVLPDVPRYLAGDPAHMQRRGRETGKGRVLSLVIGTGARSTVTGAQYRNFGLAVCAVIDKLENSGLRVELTAMSSADMAFGKEMRITTGWLVKKAEDALDLAAIAFSFAHPACHRRLTFALRECAPIRFKDTDMGRSLDLEHRDYPEAAARSFFISGVNKDGEAARTVAGAYRLVAERINKAAGEELVSVED